MYVCTLPPAAWATAAEPLQHVNQHDHHQEAGTTRRVV
eukprot:gene20787-biopygen14649